MNFYGQIWWIDWISAFAWERDFKPERNELKTAPRKLELKSEFWRRALFLPGFGSEWLQERNRRVPKHHISLKLESFVLIEFDHETLKINFDIKDKIRKLLKTCNEQL